VPELRQIPLDQIDEPLNETRTEVDTAQVVELAESIKSIGLLQPIGVVPVGDRYRRAFGQRRLLAHRWLGRPTIAAYVLEAGEGDEVAAGSAENLCRRDLTPVEEARALRHMLEARGLSVKAIGAATGHTESWVRSRLLLLTFPEEVLAAIHRRDLNAAVAAELVGIEDPQARAFFLRCAIENGVTAAQMRAWRNDWELQQAANPGVPIDPASVDPPPVYRPPTIQCAVCDEDHLITSLILLRVCSSCDEALRVQKHDERVRRRLAGGT
jgi:ParB family transcriptional regulator, chromosome partitioning protein